MAFRSANTTVNSNASAMGAINLPAGIQVGDYLACVWTLDDSGATFTPPANWTERANTSQTSPDGHRHVYFDRIANGNEASERTWTTSSTAFAIVGCAAWSGRSTSAPRRFLSAPAANTSANASPVSVTLASGTASATDDIAYWGCLDPFNSGWTWTPPTGDAVNGAYTEQIDNSAISFCSLTLATFDNSGAGALGNITAVATLAAGQSGYAGFVVAIAAAAANVPGAPYGSRLCPNVALAPSTRLGSG